VEVQILWLQASTTAIDLYGELAARLRRAENGIAERDGKSVSSASNLRRSMTT
jgi:hypothetical protein